MEHSELADAFRKELAPKGQLENTFVNEIIYAASRLQHCADDDDRSRNFAHRILRNAVADLRRIQTDRLIREELDPALPTTGLAGYRELIAAFNAQATLDLQTRKLNGTDTVSKIIDKSLPGNWVRSAKAKSNAENQPPPSANAPLSSVPLRDTPSATTPRNAACPCGAREKFKRCCGKNAPPVLSPGIGKAA